MIVQHAQNGLPAEIVQYMADAAQVQIGAAVARAGEQIINIDM